MLTSPGAKTMQVPAGTWRDACASDNKEDNDDRQRRRTRTTRRAETGKGVRAEQREAAALRRLFY